MLTTDNITGSPNWLDIASSDIPATSAFYGAVFGWTYESAGPDTGGYGFFQVDGKTVAAIGELVGDDAVPAWTVYFNTPDAEATAKAVEEGGGTVRVAPFDVLDAGRMACFTDPGGAEFAVFQPGSVKGLEVTSKFNTFGWAELHAADAPAAMSFYRSLFDWRGGELDLGGTPYTTLSTATGDMWATSFGGLTTAQDGAHAHWLPYFDVADADDSTAKVQENGGSVLMPVVDVPGVGRLAHFADPSGVAFAVLQPA
jgi:predicted enzyme related to lactoylglutathione lyase